MEMEILYVSLYQKHTYGGPEEGGWWYNRFEFLRKIAIIAAPPYKEPYKEDGVTFDEAQHDDNLKRREALDALLAGLTKKMNLPEGQVLIIERKLGGTDDTKDPAPQYE